MQSKSLKVVRDFMELLPAYAVKHGVHNGPDEIKPGEVDRWEAKVSFGYNEEVVVNFEDWVCSGTVLLECSYTITEAQALALYTEIVDRHLN